MRAVVAAYGRALHSQLSGKMLLLSAVPFLLSVALWGGVLYMGLQPLIDWLHALFADYGWFGTSNSVLTMLGLGALKTIVVPLIAMLVLLPLMMLTSLLFMAVAAMPAIVRHVSQRRYPDLEQKHGGSFLGSVWINLSCMLVFILLWIAHLPLYAVAPLALLAQIALWGWLTSRVMSYDALADHASAEERAAIMHSQRWPLFAIGVASGMAGALPGIAWIGGTVLSVVLFPFLALLSIWLYVVIFIFTGLWFQYFCLQALADLRGAGATAPVPVSRHGAD